MRLRVQWIPWSINRNIVECKEFSFCGSFDCSDGINRNIVECKEQDAYNSRQDHTSINRNIVECKARSVSFDCPEPISVLIETSWNVKKKLKTIMRICRRVLIETSWNVKLYTTFYIVSIHRINRNIVECKVLKVYTTYIRIFRINRNIVECKAHKQYFTVYFCIVIIETLWNVKYVK